MKRWAFLVVFFIFIIPYTTVHASCRSIPPGGCHPSEQTCYNPSTHLPFACCDGTLGPDECGSTYYPAGTNASSTNPSGVLKSNKICEFAGDKKDDCDLCMKNDNASWTAIGCIQASPSDFIKKVLAVGIGMAGGIAFLLILFGGLQIILSRGNPEKLNAGREIVTSAIAGLLMVIFSVFILKVIGVDILAIPGFFKG